MVDASGSSLEAGRAAVRGRRWEDAFTLLSAADGEPEGGLGAEDLESLGDVAWVTSRYGEFFRAYERAFAAYVAQGHEQAAAGVAAMLANEYFPRGELAVGAGWHHTAARLLEGRPEGRAHALHSWTHAQLAVLQRDLAAALAHSTRTAEIGLAGWRRRPSPGDPESAALELRAARGAFERLGATPDAGRATDALRSLGAGDGTPADERALRTFMFTDIAGSTPLVEALGDEAWSTCSGGTTRRCERSSSSTRARRSTTPGTASSWPSGRRLTRSSAQWRSSGRSPSTACTTASRLGCASACTPARPRRAG